MPPVTISIFGKTWHQVEDFEQLRRQDQNDRSRRTGLKYFVLYNDDESSNGILIEQTITAASDPEWLEKAISYGHIYLQAVDHEITYTAWKSRVANEKAEAL